MIPLLRSAILPDPVELARLQASYRRRRTLWIMATVMWSVAVIGALFAFGATVPQYLGVLAAAWLLSALIGLSAWRCPRCGQQLGRTWSVSVCPHCFVELEQRQETS
jgi:hypothetical protein